MNQDSMRDPAWWRIALWMPTIPRFIATAFAGGLVSGLAAGLKVGLEIGLAAGPATGPIVAALGAEAKAQNG